MRVSDMQITVAQRKGWGFWSHLVLATMLSLAMPFLGSAYLGLKAPNEQAEWQRRAASLSAVMFVAVAFPYVVNFERSILLVIGSFWGFMAALSVVSLWRAAVRKNSAIVIAPGGLNALVAVFNICILSYFSILWVDWPEVVLFRATETTPTVTEGDLLYGLKYSPMRDDDGWQVGRLQRGHLVVARIAGNETLIRVLAVPGDIVAIDRYAVLINGSRILLGGRIVSSPSSADALAELAQKKTSIVKPKHLLVTRDAALLNPPSGEPAAFEIREADVVLVPWAKVWSIGGHPGKDSDLDQPKYPFFRN